VALRIVQFLAIVLTALSLVPGGAHLFELLNKINLTAEQYFVVQGIYRGWNLFAFVLIPAVIVNFVLAVMMRAHAFASAMAFLAGACMIATLVIFFIWVGRPIAPPSIGRRSPRIGSRCAGSGSTATPSMPS
jgi:hypothetical protein